MRSTFWLLTSVALAAAASASAAPPARVEITYEVSRNGMLLGEVTHRLEHDGRAYLITETWKGRGLLALRGSATRVSRGVIAADGLRPLEFSDERTGRNTARVRFDWDARTVVMQYRGEPRTEPLPERAHDRLAFAFDFAFAGARDVTFDLLDGRGQSRHRYTIDGRERITVPAGQFDAVRVVRRTDKDRTELWLAEGRSLLPARVLVVDKDGVRIEQVATRISAQ